MFMVCDQYQLDHGDRLECWSFDKESNSRMTIILTMASDGLSTNLCFAYEKCFAMKKWA